MFTINNSLKRFTRFNLKKRAKNIDRLAKNTTFVNY